VSACQQHAARQVAAVSKLPPGSAQQQQAASQPHCPYPMRRLAAQLLTDVGRGAQRVHQQQHRCKACRCPAAAAPAPRTAERRWILRRFLRADAAPPQAAPALLRGCPIRVLRMPPACLVSAAHCASTLGASGASSQPSAACCGCCEWIAMEVNSITTQSHNSRREACDVGPGVAARSDNGCHTPCLLRGSKHHRDRSRTQQPELAGR
jgi:hypothetical protein